MPRFTPRRLALSLHLSFVLALAACGDEQGATADARTTLHFDECALPISDPAAVCGRLTVPENRASAQSRLITLPFVILPATQPGPRKDPVALYAGGPGPSALELVASLPAFVLAQLPLRRKRDLIVLNQRGSAHTEPHDLDCPELALDPGAGEQFESEAAMLAAVEACRARLIALGTDLSGYDSTHNARDMEELRILLGRARNFSKWNIVGSSYGSRLALVSMRDAPAGIRAVVLDAPFPVQTPAFYDANTLEAVAALTDACAGQPSCASAFPDLRARFSAAVLGLEASPATLGGKTITGHAVVNMLGWSLGGGEYREMPRFMDLVARGDLAAAHAILPLDLPLDLHPNARGMHLSVMCRDDGDASSSMSDLPRLGGGWPDMLRLITAYHAARADQLACPTWTRGQAPQPLAREPVRSDIPTLITVGQFDARTPVAQANVLLEDLSRARSVVFPGRGHGMLEYDLCMQELAADFLDDPHGPIDTSCVQALPEDAFALE